MKRPEKILCLNKAVRDFLLPLLCFLVLQGLCGETVWAKAVHSSLAHKMVNGWLVRGAEPIGSRLSSEVKSVETFADTNGQAIYYAVYLRPNGFVIVPADDLVEPIVCFSSKGSFDPSQKNPLGAMVSRDLPGRVDAAREIQRQTALGPAGRLSRRQSEIRDAGEKAFVKWNKLLGAADNNGTGIRALGTGGVSDVRVSPLLQSEWSQGTVCSKACYNYYTPPGSEGSSGNYPCGCIATAMAQYMRYWQYPTGGVGISCFRITVNGLPQTNCLRGGDGSWGPYNWADMTLVPGCGTTLTQRQAIGALTYDAGVAVNMDYASDGSGAYIDAADTAMTDTFGYSNSILGYNSNNNIGAGLNGMINPNLDMGNPVILAIYNSSTSASHAVVADGYGYNSSTLYHHLNMGWDGVDDVWYNLPKIDAPTSSYNVIYGVIYNIYISGSGEIISGRITDSGLPISGVTVTATRTGGGTYQATTNANGIYAIANVPSSSAYTVIASKTGDYFFAGQVVHTGQSSDYQPTSGNCWAIDFASVAMVRKCTVTAGSKENTDKISFSGTMNPSVADILAADELVVDINSANMVNRFVQAFPRNLTTFKKGRFSSTIINRPFKTSFAFNTNTSKFSFLAKNLDLTGLSCPLEVRIGIGDYNGVTEVNEAVVNGKRPMPIQLLMGVSNSLRADKWKFMRDRNTGNITQVAVRGGFSVASLNDANMADNDFVVELAGQTFTVPAGNFKANKKGDKFACLKVDTSNGIAYATFNFSKCTFTLTIKNTNFAADAGTADFLVDFASFSGTVSVILP